MAVLSKEYIRNIIPEDLPDGREILKEGVELAKSIKTGKTRFLKDTGYNTYIDYWQDSIKRGDINFTSNIGLANLKEQLEGLEELTKWCKKNEFKMHFPLCIPSMLLGIPKELREDAAVATSYLMKEVGDYVAHEQIEGITCMQANQTLFSPNGLETTINCVKAGSPEIGISSQLTWNFQGCNDHVNYVMNSLRALGILKAKKKDGFFTIGYPEDGIGGFFVDCASYVGYLMFERYIYEELCGVSFLGGFGNLVNDVRYKAALVKAMGDVCRTEDHPGLCLLHACTTSQWSHDIETNYGSSLQELLVMILAERRYKSGAHITTVPVTEALCVPTLQNIENILGAAARMDRVAEQWEEIIDFTKADAIAEEMTEIGHKFFDNIMGGLTEAGIDTEDPLQMMMFIKNVNASLFEETFHPSVKERGSFTPYFPNEMGKILMNEINKNINELTEKGLVGSMRGKKILIASFDNHVYGMRCTNRVLSAMGADVVEAGVDFTPQSILDMADEEGIYYVGVSTHNGQSLDFAEQLVARAKEKNRNHFIFMGGVLNTILPGHSEPSDVTTMIREKGVFASNDFTETIIEINRIEK